MTGDGVPVVEMAVLVDVKFDLTVVVEAGGNVAFGRDGLDDGKVAVGDAERLVGCRELYAVAHGEFAVDLTVDADANKAARIVGGLLTEGFFDGEQVGGGIDADNRSIGSGIDSGGLAAPCIADHIIDFIVACPQGKRI